MSWDRRTGAVALALAAAVASGCGGGPEDVTAEELVSKGDEICRLGQERFTEIQDDPPANASEAVEQTDLLIQESEDELNALRDLEPPDELREPYDRYLEARGRFLEFLRRGRDAADELAQAVGFQVCSKPPEPG
jgi:hypothetical protein